MSGTDSEGARDEAFVRVQGNSGTWFERAIDAVARLPLGEMTGEDIRRRVVQSIDEEPHHHNAWGALINQAIKRGYIFDTGETTNMKKKSSHARRTPVYRIPMRPEFFRVNGIPA